MRSRAAIGPAIAAIVLALGMAAGLAWRAAPAPGCPGANAGACAARSGTAVRFLRNATAEFDKYTAHATAAEQEWMRKTYWRMRAYSPFFEN